MYSETLAFTGESWDQVTVSSLPIIRVSNKKNRSSKHFPSARWRHLMSNVHTCCSALRLDDATCCKCLDRPVACRTSISPTTTRIDKRYFRGRIMSSAVHRRLKRQTTWWSSFRKKLIHLTNYNPSSQKPPQAHTSLHSCSPPPIGVVING